MKTKRIIDMEYQITKQWQDRTVKDYLYTVVGVSRSVLTHLKKKENGILLNGKRVTVRAVLKENDCLTLGMDDRDDERTENIIPSDMPLCIAYEDEHLFVINKAPNMPTHPTHGHYEDTLANALAGHVLKNGREPMVFRAVNRLDRDTSGLVIVAKHKLAAARLAQFLQTGRIQKQYIAVLCGSVEEDEGKIDRPICRVSDSIITRRCCEQGQGDDALTRYRVLCRNGDHTVVLASPITGRTHQLRVHFASIGHPIMGDTLYGSPSPEIDRQALHAVRLCFPHPVTEKMLDVRCELPEDMRKWQKEIEFEIEIKKDN